MNYWPRWINAIANATAHLTLAQMGAYDRLLDHAYKTEQPLPGSLEACCRIVRAMSKEERHAVESVLSEFWVLGDGGFTQDRVTQEIELAQPKIAAARSNGKAGGRPKGTRKKPNGFPSGNPPGTQDEPNSKAPHPHPQSERKEPIGSSPSPGAGASPGSLVCAELRRLGIAAVNPAHPLLLELLDAGATVEEFAGAAAKAMDANDPFAYLLACVSGERQRARQTAAGLHRGPMPARAGPAEPAWKAEQRQRMAEFAGPAAAKPATQPQETIDVAARIVG